MKMVDYFDKDYLEANPNFYDYIYQLAYNFAGAESQDLRFYSIILLFKFLNNSNKKAIKERIEYVFDTSNTWVKRLIIRKILNLKKYTNLFTSILVRARCLSNTYICSLIPNNRMKNFSNCGFKN